MGAAALLAALTACRETQHCGVGQSFQSGACMPRSAGNDASGNDASADAATDAGGADAPCGGACSSPTHCLAATGRCVECLTSDDCVTAATPACSATNTCAPCTTDADCTHLAATPACNTTGGACVACTPTNESACGANSCNPMTHTCTTTPRMSVTTCHGCLADTECANTMDRCVPMQFMGSAHGSYCLRQLIAGCSRPYGAPTPARASTSGAPAATYCGLDETTTTCEALQALTMDTACPTGASECHALGAQCQIVNGTMNRCTYGCTLSSQCPTGANCGALMYCGSP